MNKNVFSSRIKIYFAQLDLIDHRHIPGKLPHFLSSTMARRQEDHLSSNHKSFHNHGRMCTNPLRNSMKVRRVLALGRLHRLKDQRYLLRTRRYFDLAKGGHTALFLTPMHIEYFRIILWAWET